MILPSTKIFALCTCVLSLQMLILAAMTAARRAKVNQYLNPEDKAVAFKDARCVDGPEHPDVARIIRAHRNMLESIPLFFGLGIVYLLVDASYRAAPILFGVFTVARLVHSFVYLREMQPWRTIAYGVASLSLVGMMGMILRTVLRH